MQNDAMFIIGLFVFFFLLWAFSGGPSRPISFAGPYITPITNEGQTQAGYGPQVKVGGTIALPGAALTATERTPATPAATQTTTPAPVTPTSKAGSSLFGKYVTITHVAGTTSNPTGFVQINVSASAGQSIDITNWSITSSAVRESSQIPTGILVMQLGAKNTLQEILLKPG